MHANLRRIILPILIAGLLGVAGSTAQALGRPGLRTAPYQPLAAGFTYQGRLTGASGPVDGMCDFEFRLWDALTGGTQAGAPVTATNVVVSRGLFNVTLDFGAGVFDGSARWLAVAVRCPAGTGAFTPLDPRQALTATPYAQYAPAAGSVPWSGVTGAPPQLPAGCDAGYVARWDGAAWICALDQDTQYSPGTGLILNGTTFSLAAAYRLPQSCAPGSLAKVNGSATGWECGGDNNTTYSAGFGLALTGTTFRVLTTTVQARVNGTCGVGSTVSAINADGTVVCHADAPLNRALAPLTNTLATTAAAGGGVGGGTPGWGTAVTIGADGLPIVSFLDNSNAIGKLRVVHCTAPDCAAYSAPQVDGNIGTGQWSSIALGTDGLPLISYHDRVYGRLKTAHCNDAACATATLTTHDSPLLTGDYTSIAIGADGLGLISEYAAGTQDLKVAHCSDTACTAATVTALDTEGDVGKFTALIIGIDGLGLISYYDVTNGALKVAHCTNVPCTGATLVTLSEAAGAGQGTSLVLGADGHPLIVYVDEAGRLKAARCTAYDCAAAEYHIVDAGSTIGTPYTSVTLGPDGLPLIAYADSNTGQLKYARCLDAACASVVLRTLDPAPQAGEYAAITLGPDGLPVVSYLDMANRVLKVARCANVWCVPNLRAR